MKGDIGMTIEEARLLLEMVKDIVRELHDEDKIIQRIEEIQSGVYTKKQ
jgi:hypothetical protein